MRTYPLTGPMAAFWSPFGGPAAPARPAPAAPPGRPIPFLGQGADGALSAARSDLRKAEEYLGRLEAMYGDLVLLVGSTKAMRAVAQARSSVERARTAYGSAAELADMGGGPSA